MSIPYNYVRARVRLGHIVHNYRLLSALGGGVIPVIKADAYGHGLFPVAGVLAAAGAETFAVGSVAEAMALRDAGCTAAVISLLGPVTPEDDAALFHGGIIPFVHSFPMLERLSALADQRREKLEIALKFDTGMARLGFTQADVPALIRRLQLMQGLSVRLVSSHLATADEPSEFDFVEEQGRAFAAVCKELAQGGFTFEANLCNSAGILAHADHAWHGQRAGLALYGANPFFGSDKAALGQGLLPAMEVVSRIVSVHDLAKGTSISYGRTFTADRDMRVAVVAAGYADAYSRLLSNAGMMWLQGRRVPVVGRVCMQLTAVDVTGIEAVAPDDQIHLLGGQGDQAIRAEELAGWWGTIAYEVFCLLGLNQREYIHG